MSKYAPPERSVYDPAYEGSPRGGYQVGVGPSGQYGGWRELFYPPPGSAEANQNIPVWLQMSAVPYQNKTFFRSNNADPGSGDNYATITLPLPLELTTANSANYAAGTVWGRGSVLDLTSGAYAEGRLTGAGQAGAAASYLNNGSIEEFGNVGIKTLEKFAEDVIGISGFRGEMPMDQRDQVFTGVNFRNFTYSWQLIPKTVNQAFTVANICNALQTLLYPVRNVRNNFSATRVQHPPMWYISSFDYKGGGPKHRWTMYPQISLLQSVSIQPRTGAGAPWVLGDGSNGPWPAITNLSVNFVELEPNINVGKNIANRSTLLNNTNANTNGFWNTQGGL